MTRFALVTLLAVPVILHADTPKDIAGRPVADWVKDLGDKQALVREEALEVLAAAKIKEAIAALEKLLDDPHPGVRRRAALALWKIDGRTAPAIAMLAAVIEGPNEPQARREALMQLRDLQPPDEQYVPLLLKLLDDGDASIQTQARGLLRFKSAKALPALLAALPKADREQRLRIVTFLGSLATSPDREKVLPVLRELAAKAEGRVRVEAARALLTTNLTDAAAIATLVEVATSDDVVARQMASQVILSRRPSRKEYEPVYRAALKDRDDASRARAAEALYELDRSSLKDIAPVLIDLLKDGGSMGSMTAMNLLPRLGPDAKVVLPQIAELIAKADPGTTNELLRLITVMGRMGPEAAPHLVKLFKHQDASVRAVAGNAMGQIGAAAIPHLEPLLASEELDVRRAAFQAISLMGANSDRAAKLVVKGLSDSDGNIRSYALAKLSDVALDKTAVSPLIEMLRNTSQGDYHRTLAAVALGRLGPDAREALPELGKHLGGQVPSLLRMRCAMAVWRISGKESEVKPILLAALKDDREVLAMQPGNLLEALAELGADPAEVVAIVAKMGETNPNLGRSAMMALARYYPGEKAALPALREAVKHRNPNFRREAALTLAKYGEDGKEAAPVLATLLRVMPDPTVLAGLDDLGPAGAAALPILLEIWPGRRMLADKAKLAEIIVAIDREKGAEQLKWLQTEIKANHDAASRIAVAVALARHDPKNPAVVPALMELAKERNRYVAGQALTPLGTLKVTAAAPIMREKIKDAEPWLRLKAAEGLWKLEGKPADVVATLAALLTERPSVTVAMGGGVIVQPWTIATESARLLGEMGPAAADALPALRRAAGDPEVTIRLSAARALKKIQPK